jgi:hypothetical protein
MLTRHQIDEILPVGSYNTRGYIGWTRNNRPYIKFMSNGKTLVRFIKHKALDEALKAYLGAHGQFTRDICRISLNNDGGVKLDYPGGFEVIVAPDFINLLIQYNAVSRILDDFSFREIPEMIIVRTNIIDEPTARYSTKGCDCPSGRSGDRLCVHSLAVHLKYSSQLQNYFDWKAPTKKKDIAPSRSRHVPKEYQVLYEELEKAAKNYKTEIRELTWNPGFFTYIWQGEELMGSIQHNCWRQLCVQPKGQKLQRINSIDAAMNLVVTESTACIERADRGDKVFVKTRRLPTIHGKTGIVTSRAAGGVMVNIPGWRLEFFMYSEIGLISSPCMSVF